MANWRNRRLSPADEAFVADVEKRLTPPTVVNPSAIGDPNQTPVVYIGDAGKALGIPERSEQRPDGQVETFAVADFGGPCPHGEALAQLRTEWRRTLADLDAAREALRRAEESIGAWTRAADRAEDERVPDTKEET